MIPPSNPTTEAALLGAMLNSEEAVYGATAELVPEDFFVPWHRDVYRELLAQANLGGVNYHLLVDVLERAGDKQAHQKMAHLQACSHELTRVADYVKAIRDAAILRGSIDTFRGLASRASEKNIDVVEFCIEAEDKTAAAFERKIHFSSCAGIREVAAETRRRLTAGPAPAVPTGYPDLDRKLGGGLPYEEYTLLAARPSVGKSSLALSIATSAARTGKRVGIYSMEMSKNQLVLRAAQQEARVPTVDNRRFSDDDMPRVMEALDLIEALPIFIDDGDVTVGLLKAKARRMAKKLGGLDLIIVDYLQLVAPASVKASREQQVSEISKGLAGLAHQMGYAVLALSQLSRKIESRENKRPLLSDLRESGSLEQDADNVAFLWRPKEFDETVEFDDEVELLIAKQRNGPTGSIGLTFHRSYCKFNSRAYEKSGEDDYVPF